MENNKVIVITGANSSIGLKTTIDLAKLNHCIVMVCRNKERGENALSEVKKITGNSNVHLMLCDLSSFQSIKHFVDEFKKLFGKLDVLINNAGIMSHDKTISEDGFEMHFQVNYLSPFLLTHLLIPYINDKGRIINVSSLAHKMGKINFNDFNLKENFSMLRAYAQSKLAILMFSYELSEKLKEKQITVNALHPGIIVSNLGIYTDKLMINFITKKVKWLFSSPQKGSETTTYLAISPQVSEITGKYFYKKKPINSSKKSYDKTLQNKLWKVTMDLLHDNIDNTI